jgi:predicted aspartyl protease
MSPDDNSPLAGNLAENEATTPIAETYGAAGSKWYLIKTKNGLLGWLKQSASGQSKTLDNFFKSLPPETSSSALPLPVTTVASAPRGAIIVPVQFTGRSVIVTVTLNRTMTANLTLDTGATNTVISRRLASSLSLRPIGTAFVQTVGSPVSAQVTSLKSMKVGAAEANDLQVIVHNFSNDPRIEGLLGMDFLGRYQVALDSQKQVLVLTPR